VQTLVNDPDDHAVKECKICPSENRPIWTASTEEGPAGQCAYMRTVIWKRPIRAFVELGTCRSKDHETKRFVHAAKKVQGFARKYGPSVQQKKILWVRVQEYGP